MTTPASERRAAPPSGLVCRRCGHSAFERIPRRGSLQRLVLKLFHRYPWRCALCNDITWRRERKTTDLSPDSPFRDFN